MICALEEEPVLERESLQQSLLRHRDDAYLLALRLAGNQADAEDAVQDAYVQAFQSRSEILSAAEQRKWLLTITANCVKRVQSRDKQRKAREQRKSQMEDYVQAAPAENASGVREALSTALQELDENQRVSVSLHHEFGLSYAQASEICGLPAASMRVYAQRGLDALRQKLTAAGFSLSPLALASLLCEPSGIQAPAGLQAKLDSLALQSPKLPPASHVPGAVQPFFMLKAAGLVGALTLILAFCALLPGRSTAPKDDENPPAAPAPGTAPLNDPFANAGPELSKLLNLGVDVAYNRNSFTEIAKDLNKRIGLQVTPVLNWALMFSMTQREAPVRTVLTALAQRGGFSIECHGDAIVFWKRDDAAIKKSTEKLHSGTVEERCEAADELGRLDDPRIYRALFQALRDPDQAVAAWATRALMGASMPVAYGDYTDADLAPLIEKLKGPEADPRLIEVAGRTGRDCVTAPLIALTDSPHTQTQLYAIMALGNLHTAAAFNTVLTFAASKYKRLRAAAFMALWNSREPRAISALNTWFTESAKKEEAQPPQQQVFEFSSNGPAPGIGELSEDGEAAVTTRELSLIESDLQALPWRVSRPLARELTQRAQSGGSAPRDIHLPGIFFDCTDQEATELVSRLNTPKAVRDFQILRVPAVVEAFRRAIEAGPAVYAEKLLSVAQGMRDPAVLQAVAAKLAENRSARLLNFSVRNWWFVSEPLGGEMMLAYAGQTLPTPEAFESGTATFSGKSRAYEALASQIEKGSPEFQAKALSLIGHVYDRRALPLLERAIESSAKELRIAAINSLAWSRFPEAVPILLKYGGDSDPAVRASIADALEPIDDPRGLTLARNMLTDADAKVRVSAAKCLGLSFLPRAEKEVCAAAASTNPAERAAAATAMAEMTDARRVADLLKLLNDPAAAVRAAAAEGLWSIASTRGVELGPEAFAGMAVHAKQDADTAVQMQCMEQLGHLGNSESTLIELLSHPQPKIRIQAAKLLDSKLAGFLGIQTAVDPEKIKTALAKYATDHPGEYAPQNAAKPAKNDF